MYVLRPHKSATIKYQGNDLDTIKMCISNLTDLLNSNSIILDELVNLRLYLQEKLMNCNINIHVLNFRIC